MLSLMNTKPAADAAAAADAEPEPDAMEVDNDESNFVSYAETVEFLGSKVQRSASKLNVQAATVHLDRFLRALHSGNAQKTRKDTTLHAFFSKK
jgi:hypothetical protein